MGRYNLTNDDCITLSHAIIIRACDDWRELCNGKLPTGECNFDELEEFFRVECDAYLTGTRVIAAEILKELQGEHP